MYNLVIKHSLDELLGDYLALDQNDAPGSLLLVQNRHLAEWMHYEAAMRQAIYLHRPVMFPDEAMRALAEALQGQTTSFLYADSLALLVWQWLQARIASGASSGSAGNDHADFQALDAWLVACGGREQEVYALAAKLAGLLYGYAQHGRIVHEQWRQTQGGWQVALWDALFSLACNGMPAATALEALTQTMSPAPVEGLQLANGRRIGTINIFGSAFLPNTSLHFLQALSDHGYVQLNHFVYLPFKVSGRIAASPTRDWAKLGLGLLAELAPYAGNTALPELKETSELIPVLHLGSPIRIISCRNRRRQVEVLKEEILSVLDNNASLAVNRIAVLVPDPELFRPFVETIFPAWGVTGQPDPSQPSNLPFHFLDMPADDSRFLQGFRFYMDLYGKTLFRSSCTQALRNPAVRQAFGIQESETDQCVGWLDAAGIKSDLDAADRALHSGPELSGNTWSAGLERLLLGFVLPDDGPVAVVAVSNADARLFGRFTKLVDVLWHLSQASWFSGTKTVGDWASALRKRFLDEGQGEHDDPLQISEQQTVLLAAEDADPGPGILSRALSACVQRTMDLEACGRIQDGEDLKLPFPVFLSVLQEHLDSAIVSKGQALLQGVCIARFQPFRTIPFDYIFMLGMDEGAFPSGVDSRSLNTIRLPDGALDQLDPRTQDSYAFLETLASTRAALCIMYQGRDESSETLRLPCSMVQDIRNGRLPGVIAEWYEAPLNALERPFAAGRADAFLRSRLHLMTTAAPLAPPYSVRYASAWQGVTVPQTLAVKELAAIFKVPLAWFVQRRFGIFLQDKDDSGMDDAISFQPAFWDMENLQTALIKTRIQELVGEQGRMGTVADLERAMERNEVQLDAGLQQRVGSGQWINSMVALPLLAKRKQAARQALARVASGIAAIARPGSLCLLRQRLPDCATPEHESDLLIPSFHEHYLHGNIGTWLYGEDAQGQPFAASFAFSPATAVQFGKHGCQLVASALALAQLSGSPGFPLLPDSQVHLFLNEELISFKLSFLVGQLGALEDYVAQVWSEPVPLYPDLLQEYFKAREALEGDVALRQFLQAYFENMEPADSSYAANGPLQCQYFNLMYGEAGAAWPERPYNSEGLLTALKLAVDLQLLESKP